jgi:alpha-L-fucosidase
MRVILSVLFTFCLCTYLICQEYSNFIYVPKGDSLDSIVRLAAHIKPSSRQIMWQELELTCFFHFGINTFYDMEWGRKDYTPAAFNPTQLDVRQWARTVKAIGGKMMIMLAKHHDGFCYWQTKYTDFSVKNSPWRDGKGDLIAEAAAACREYGLKLGVYLSPWDINSPIYGTNEYNDYFKNQLFELLTNYGKVDEVWFDGACGEGPNGRKQVYDWHGYYAVIRKLQPEAVIAIMGPDVRWVGTESGYGREAEWSVLPVSAATLDEIAQSSQQEKERGAFVPAGNMQEQVLGSREKLKNAEGLIWYPSEVDVSVRPGWFYHQSEDTLVKSPEKLVDIYYSSIGRNSVLLLNFSPDKRGLINEHDVDNVIKMREIIDSTFKVNFVSLAEITVQHPNTVWNPKAMSDGENKTYWTPGTEVTSTSMELDLGKDRIFDRLLLQENFRDGQRVEEFVLEALRDGEWNEVVKGTTIGYKRLLRFAPAEARKVRLRIISSRDCPEISAIGLYKSPEAK